MYINWASPSRYIPFAVASKHFYLTYAAWHQPKDSDEAEDDSQASGNADDSSASEEEAPKQKSRKPRSGKRRQILIDDDADEPDDIESFEEDGSRSDNDIEVARPSKKKPANGPRVQGSIESFFGKLPLGAQSTACR